MGRACTICARPDAGTLNALLAEGRSARSVALERGLSEDALQRHALRHATRRTGNARLPVESPLSTSAKAEVGHGATDFGAGGADPLDELVDALREQALAGNPALVHQYRLALAAQADARHAPAPLRSLATEPEWLELRGAILAALAEHPEARQAVADALEGLA